jgi:alginate O-acetyltransferase complex protein AlgI
LELISWAMSLFLLIALPVYWVLPKPRRAPFLCIAGFCFYCVLQPQGGIVALLYLWIVLLFQRLILASQTVRGKKWIILLGAIVALTPMIIYKYRLSIFSGIPIVNIFAELPLVVPVGISYFTFRAVHFLVETHRGKIGHTSGIDFFYYITFIPTVVAGPIERFPTFSKQQKNIDKFDPELFGEGVLRIAIGLVKKLVLADMFYGFISPFMAAPSNLALSPAQIWLCLHGYYAYLYMDFSGYSDIAIGISRLFGFRIMENFNWPIFAHNIRDFWRRWHISLTGWLTEYVYYTLGGNRAKPSTKKTRIFGIAVIASLFLLSLSSASNQTDIIGRIIFFGIGIAIFLLWSFGLFFTEINAMVTMMLIALWHGSVTLKHFFIWGLYLGLGIVVLRYWLQIKARFFPRFVENPTVWGKVIGAVMTIEFMNISWPIFLFDQRVAFIMYMKMFGLVD